MQNFLVKMSFICIRIKKYFKINGFALSLWGLEQLGNGLSLCKRRDYSHANSFGLGRVQRKSVLQPAIRASCSWHVLAHKSFQLVPKPFLISRIDHNPSVIWISPRNSTCLSGKLRTKITSPIAKSTCPGLSYPTFFAPCWVTFCLLPYLN